MDFQKHSGLYRWSLSNLRWAVWLFFDSGGFFLETPPWMAFGFSVLIIEACSYRRCSKGGLQISRCYVSVCFYLIYYCSCGSWGYFGRASTSRPTCCHVKCCPFINASQWTELKSFKEDFIAFSQTDVLSLPSSWCPLRSPFLLAWCALHSPGWVTPNWPGFLSLLS